jgi:hypothetical protein
MIYQADNGGEVQGKEVSWQLKEMNPLVTTVHGQPKTPRDQGSVEIANRYQKQTVSKLERQEHLAKSGCNWTMLSCTGSASINAGERKDRKVSPYEAVLNQKYFEMYNSILNELWSCKAGNDLASMLPPDQAWLLHELGEADGGIDSLRKFVAMVIPPHHQKITAEQLALDLDIVNKRFSTARVNTKSAIKNKGKI